MTCKAALVMGKFISCRHYRAHEKGVDCLKHGPVVNCKYCPTCPACGGKHKLDRVGAARNIEVMVCVQCGNMTEISLFPLDKRERRKKTRRSRKETTNTPGQCSVRGCENLAWDECTYDGLPICTTHRNRIKTWKAKRWGKDRFPFFRQGDELVNNPDYSTRGGES